MLSKEELYSIIGDNVRSRRRDISLNQDELAKKVGLTRSSIAQIESGKQALTIISLYRIAEALNIPIYKLLPECSSNNEFDSYSLDRVVRKEEILALLDAKTKEVTNE